MGVAPCPRHAQKEKVPPFGRTFPGLAIPRQELAASSSLLSGPLALTVRVLLLLAGLVAATLLLTRLLARVLILLTRVLVLAGHWNSLVEPCLSRTRSDRTLEPSGCFWRTPRVARAVIGTHGQNTSAQAP